MKGIILFILILTAITASSQVAQIDISSKNESEREEKVVTLLKEILLENDLSQWRFTDKVIIEERVIPHSHPTLTLNTSSFDKKDILDTYLHEQLHWYVDRNQSGENAAIEEFKLRYKNVPFGNRAGARDEYSTYLHLIVCFLEYRSLAQLLGEEESKQMMWNQTHYTWVYNKIIEDSSYIRKVLKNSGFDLVE
ncbi:MAG: hypothetical protein KDC99_16840 [Cyclobacteriaceae bacterium]|nr:hypothetical protein [Cyclobacteriaceae bacterium]